MTKLEVTLDGTTTTVDWPMGDLMLDVLEQAGLNPPFSCRSGSCGACICTLESGDVELRNNELLDDKDLAEGLILSCQATSQSAFVKVSY